MDALGAFAAPTLTLKALRSTHVAAILARLLQNRFLREKTKRGRERGEGRERRERGEKEGKRN
jgi:hypothetical protein